MHTRSVHQAHALFTKRQLRFLLLHLFRPVYTEAGAPVLQTRDAVIIGLYHVT